MKGTSQLSLLLGVGIVLSAVIPCNAASARQSTALSSDAGEEQVEGVIERESRQEEKSVVEGEHEQEEEEENVIEREGRQEVESMVEGEHGHEEEGSVIERESRARGPSRKINANKRGNSNKQGNSNKRGNSNKQGNSNKRGNSNKQGNSNKRGNSNKQGNSNKRGNSKKRGPANRKGGGGVQNKAFSPHNYTTECECGKQLETSRVVGGKPTTRDEYPWQAALLSAADDTLLCGGSLINNLYILTSAKCVDSISDPADLIVRLRDYNLNKPGQAKEITKNVEEIIVHQNYEEEPRRADIALLKLDSALTLSQLATVRPICLPSNTRELYQRERAIATGWGQTDSMGDNSNVLRDVNMKVISNSKCRSALPFGPTRVKKNMLCAGNDNKNICYKDEGGPLAFLNTDGLYEQIGIGSFSDACGDLDEPAVFTRVNQFLYFIRTNAVGATYCTGFSFPGE